MLASTRSSLVRRLLLGTALPLILLTANPIVANADVVVVNGADGVNGAPGTDTTPGGTGGPGAPARAVAGPNGDATNSATATGGIGDSGGDGFPPGGGAPAGRRQRQPRPRPPPARRRLTQRRPEQWGKLRDTDDARHRGRGGWGRDGDRQCDDGRGRCCHPQRERDRRLGRRRRQSRRRRRRVGDGDGGGQRRPRQRKCECDRHSEGRIRRTGDTAPMASRAHRQVSTTPRVVPRLAS
jgi:hypothetical protein